jgi:hypothetical protein
MARPRLPDDYQILDWSHAFISLAFSANRVIIGAFNGAYLPSVLC